MLDSYLPRKLRDRTIVAITSKVVSLCEGRLVPLSGISKDELIKRESQRYVAQSNPYGFTFTVTNDTLVPAAGIDESNAGGGYLLWPADPQATVNAVRKHLRVCFGIKHIGALITDSTCSPLRRGTTGICLAHSGFRAVNDYIGKPDLFGRRFKVSQANVAGGLAATAVLVMGEGRERTPICLIDDPPLVRFQDRNPRRPNWPSAVSAQKRTCSHPFWPPSRGTPAASSAWSVGLGRCPDLLVARRARVIARRRPQLRSTSPRGRDRGRPEPVVSEARAAASGRPPPG